MASPSFRGCPLKLNDAGGRSRSSVLSDKCTVNGMMRDPDLPAAWKRVEGSSGGEGTANETSAGPGGPGRSRRGVEAGGVEGGDEGNQDNMMQH